MKNNWNNDEAEQSKQKPPANVSAAKRENSPNIQNQNQNKTNRRAAVLLNIINNKIQRAERSELMNAYEMPLQRCAKRTSSPKNSVPVRFRPVRRIASVGSRSDRKLMNSAKIKTEKQNRNA